MNNLSIQRLFFPFAFFYFACMAVSLAMDNYWFLLIPFIFLAIIFSVLYPKIIFWLMIIAIPFSTEYNFNGSIGTDLPDEFFMITIFILAIFALFLNHKIKIRDLGGSHLFSLIIYQLIWTAISSYHSISPLLSFKFLIAKSWYIIPFVMVPQWVIRTKKNFYVLACCIVIPIIIISCIVLFQQSRHQFTFVSVNQCVTPFFRNHVSYAAVLSFALSVLAGIFLFYHHKVNKFLIVGAILLLTVAIFFSYTRGTWLSLILSWVVLWVLYIKKIKHLLLITSLAILISITFFVQNDHYLMLKPDFEKAIVHAQLSEHIDAMYQMQDISISERIYRWVAGFRMSIVHPLFGFGPSTFYSSYKPFTDSRFKTYVSENPEKSTLHNYFLLTLVEQGFIGLLLLLLIIFSFYHQCQLLFHQVNDIFYKTVLAIICLIMTNILVINFFSDMIETDKVGSMYFLSIGILLLIKNKVQHSASNEINLSNKLTG